MKWWWLLVLVPLLAGAYAVQSRGNGRNPRQYSPEQLERLMQGVFVQARPAMVQLQTMSVDEAAGDTEHIWVAQGRATGFFVSADGYVLTAYHAVSGQTRFNVLTTRQELLPAVVVGYDQSRDLALLKATGQKPVPFIPLELTRSLKIGEPLVEIGNSGDDFIQPRYGTVQSFEQDSGNLVPTRLVFSSIVLSPGDSGGAVLDFNGKVVAVGIGFAQSDTLRVSLLVPLEGLAGEVVALKRGARINLPDVGLHVVHNAGAGVLIDRVEPGSSAAESGIAAGGVVTAVDGTSIFGQSDYYRLLRAKRPGERAKLRVKSKTATQEYDLEIR
jgi:serine protease Do